MSSAAGGQVNAVQASEGEAIWFNGGLVNVKSPGAWSDDAFSLCEVTLPKGRATGLHTDPSDETFYVLEGELLFHVDGDERRATAGDTVGIRSGIAHAFIAISDGARFLVLNTPGTHDSFFRDGGEPAHDRDLSGAPAPDQQKTHDAAERHGVRFLGPPPFADVALTSG